MRKVVLFSAILLSFCLSAISQVAVPRESQKQTITQNVGDAVVTITYSRPNVKGRTIWNGLVPYGKVWRSGANEATVFEVSRDVTINGKPLPAGKYSLHTIPAAGDWTIIFNKKWDQWGSFDYDEKLDALRVTSKPVPSEFFESLVYGFGDTTTKSATAFMRWEKLRVPFTIDVGDIHGRVLTQLREAVKNRKPDDPRPLNQAGAYVTTFKVKPSYEEALGWVNASIAIKETFGNLSAKARLLNEQGKTAEAVAIAEKAIATGKTSTPPANVDAIAGFEETVRGWKNNK